MIQVVFLLETFIFIILSSHAFATVYIDDIINVINGMSENNLNRSSTHKLTPGKYFVMLADADSTDDEDTSAGTSREVKLQRRRGPMHLRTHGVRPSHRENLKNAEKVREQHIQRMGAVIKFMEDHYMTTVYLFNEIERIKKKREVMDKLRRMVYYLERPGNEAVKDIVLKCFQNERIFEKFEVDMWKDRTPNNLIINILKDPENDGVIN